MSKQQRQQPQPSMNRSVNKRGIWQWYKTKMRNVKVSLGCATLIAMLLFVSCGGAVAGSGNTPTPSPTASPSQHIAATDATPTHPQVAQ